MPPSDSVGPADFGTAFTALLAAAGLTVDGVLSALPPGRRGRVSRSTLYDWKKGEHLPLDATGPLLEVVRVCLDAARELGAGLAVWPASEEGWRWLLAEAKQARDADIAQARHGKVGEPGSAWDKRPIGRQDPVSPGMPEVLRAGPPPGGGVFVGRAHELAVLEAAAAEARGGRPQVVLVEGEAGIGKSALLARFAAGLADAAVLRVSGDEAERLVPYGIVAQLVASARGAGGSPPGLLAAELSGAVDPLAVGAELVIWLGQVCCGQKMVLACIDDLQWADGPSARALLFAVRRLHVDQVLVVVSARAGELSRLGEGWPRFAAGDHRADRVVLGGLEPEDVVALGGALGAGELPRRAVGRLLEHTGGNPLYIRAVLEESGAEGLDGPDGAVRVPRSLAAMVLARVGALSPAARQLTTAAAVLGHHCQLAAAGVLAGLDDPLPALEEAMATGVLTEQPGGAAAGIGFPHLLVHRAVYDDLSPTWRRRLHERAAGLVDRDEALAHRVVASVGPDDGLAAELEATAREAADLGGAAQAADWLAQAAAASSDPGAADRRLLDALEILVDCGDVARAEGLAARVASAGASPRRCLLLGALDFLAGRAAAAEARLVPASAGLADPPPGPGRVRRRRRRHQPGGILHGAVSARGSDPVGSAGGPGLCRADRRASPGRGDAGDRPCYRWARIAGPGRARLPARRPHRGAAGRHRHSGLPWHGPGLGRGPGRGGRRHGHCGGEAACRSPAALPRPVPGLPGRRRVPSGLLGRRCGAR